MEDENRRAYSEVIEVLKWIDDEKKLEALPIEMLEVIKSKAEPGYKPEISKEIPLDKQNLEPETFLILSWIAKKYWSENIKEENNIDIIQESKINNREILTEDKCQQNVNIEHLVFTENNIASEAVDKENNNILPIVTSDMKWYQKLKIRIIEVLNKIFKRRIDNKQEGNI